MKHAIKLNLNIPMLFIGKGKVVVGQHMRQVKGYSKPKLIRKYLPKKQVDLVRDALPDNVKSSFLGINLTEVTLLAPHIHTEEKSVINFYIETGGEKTTFWNGEDISEDSNVIDNGNGYVNLRRDVLIETEHFVAQPSDVWLLDTQVPHSVGYLNDTRDESLHFDPLDEEKRLIMQAFFSMPYDQLANALQNKIA